MNVYAYTCDQCEGEAFYVTRKPEAGEALSDVIYGDGTSPATDKPQPVRCACCGQDPARYTGLQIDRLTGPMVL